MERHVTWMAIKELHIIFCMDNSREGDQMRSTGVVTMIYPHNRQILVGSLVS
jgi:hypothetical protein